MYVNGMSSFLFIEEFNCSLNPFIIGNIKFNIDHIPPIIIAPTPKNLIFVFHMFHDASIMLESIG